MTTIVRDGTNTPRAITAIQVRDGANIPRTLRDVRVRDSNNVSRVVFTIAPPLTLQIDPDFVAGITSGTGFATAGPVTANPTGGTAPYSYQWTLVSYDNPIPPSINGPTSQVTTFTQTNIGPGEAYTATFQCEVTDSNGWTATDNCSATFLDHGTPP